jgi:4-amino-4-deoxy-L-arabinose transferase-like glycosyltransferase
MTPAKHAARVGLLMAVAAVLLGWELRHTESTFADGLRYIHRAEKIASSTWFEGLRQGIDHPLHPLAIAAVHRLMGGSGAADWQRAAVLLCCTSAIAMVIPIYLLALELFGGDVAWLACLLAASNPLVGYIVVNVLSESTFLLWWSFGLWVSVRFFRVGRLRWLALAIVFGSLAYLTRPEGMLLPAALMTALLILPAPGFKGAMWPGRWRVIAIVSAGLMLLVGPYMTLKGGVGTKPGIARVLGLAPRSQPLALEREKPLAPGQTTFETYKIAAARTFKAFRLAATLPLFPLALIGLVLWARRSDCARPGVFLAIVLAASAVALVRLHATGGYLTIRHGLIPGLILTQSAAYGVTWSVGKLSRVSRRFNLAGPRLPHGGALASLTIALAIAAVNLRALGPSNAGSFSAYEETGRWLARNTRASEQVLDLTDWSLFFSRRQGYAFAKVYDGLDDPSTRWIVARKPHIDGHCHYSQVIRELIGDRQPVALIPADARPRQVQVCIYDRQAPLAQAALVSNTRGAATPRR